MPQIRIRPVSREERFKMKTNPFAPTTYNKYSHQLIDSHMRNHAKRITGAKSRIDTSIPKSAVSCVRSRDRFKLPAKNNLIATPLDSESESGENYFLEDYDLDGYHDNRSLSQTRMTKTGKQTITRKTTKTTTTTKTIPWKNAAKTDLLGQKTNFPSLVMSVCATQLATKRVKRNVTYKHVKSKIKELYFDSEKMNEQQETTRIENSQIESDYSSDPDHELELSSDKLDLALSDLATDHVQRNAGLNETFNLPELPLAEHEESRTISLTPELETTNQITEFTAIGPTDTSKMIPDPTQELEYLKLKRQITQECVKYNIFTPGGVKKLCQKNTQNRSDLDSERVSDLIGQILRELCD